MVSCEERFWKASRATFVTVQESEEVAEAVVAEIILIGLLVISVCLDAINKRTQSPMVSFAIGFSVTMDILAGSAASGAFMNTVHSFGPAVVANHWDFLWFYWLSQLLAGLLVGILIRMTEMSIFMKSWKPNSKQFLSLLKALALEVGKPQVYISSDFRALRYLTGGLGFYPRGLRDLLDHLSCRFFIGDEKTRLILNGP